MLEGISNELGGRLQLKLLEYAAAIRADRLVAQRQHLGDLRRRFPRCQQPEHFELLIREVECVASFGGAQPLEIDDHVTEINITSSVGFSQIEELYGEKPQIKLWDLIEKTA